MMNAGRPSRAKGGDLFPSEKMVPTIGLVVRPAQERKVGGWGREQPRGRLPGEHRLHLLRGPGSPSISVFPSFHVVLRERGRACIFPRSAVACVVILVDIPGVIVVVNDMPLWISAALARVAECSALTSMRTQTQLNCTHTRTHQPKVTVSSRAPQTTDARKMTAARARYIDAVRQTVRLPIARGAITCVAMLALSLSRSCTIRIDQSRRPMTGHAHTRRGARRLGASPPETLLTRSPGRFLTRRDVSPARFFPLVTLVTIAASGYTRFAFGADGGASNALTGRGTAQRRAADDASTCATESRSPRCHGTGAAAHLDDWSSACPSWRRRNCRANAHEWGHVGGRTKPRPWLQQLTAQVLTHTHIDRRPAV